MHYQVAAACQLDNSKIAKIEDGRFNVSLSTIIELSRGLDVAPSSLLAEFDLSYTSFAIMTDKEITPEPDFRNGIALDDLPE